jgi:hypothetical protein
MNTRSQTKAVILAAFNKINNNSSCKEEMKREKDLNLVSVSVPVPVVINFDEASTEWHSNKKRKGHEYVYICLESVNNNKVLNKIINKICGKVCYQYGTTCFIHRNRTQSK